MTIQDRMSRIVDMATALALALAATASSAHAADVTVLSGGAVKAGLEAAKAGYEAATGDKLVAEYAPMGLLRKKLEAGAGPDLVIVTEDVLPAVRSAGAIQAGSEAEVARVAIGVAVPEGAPSPDISTPEAFKALLLGAKAIAMINPATGTSGKHLAEVFQRLGIAEAVTPKLKLMDQGFAVEPVGRGEADVGLHQITEILPVKGVKLIGPVPAPLQKVTVYVGGVGAKATNPEAARRLLAHLRTAEARRAFAAKGYMAGE